ncbi:MAG: hypothetical protein JJD92_10745 [Frankiaceae bacterium]|nr:hypothetical protein [Frankiaceae bacterium]
MLTTKEAVDPALALGLEVAMLRAPRLVPSATWRLRSRDGGVEIHEPAGGTQADQPSWVSYGMAAEFLVLAMHEAGLSATVELGDPQDCGLVASFDVTASAPPSRLDAALFGAATGRHWQTLLVLPNGGSSSTAHQRDVLMMAAASQRVELVWHTPVAPGHDRQAIVTTTDDAVDWFRSGRAAAHIILRAETLGLSAELVTPSLRQAQLRATIRKQLQPPRYPQVLLHVTRVAG